MADTAMRLRHGREREAREAWLKKCEREADVIRYRLFLENIYGKGKIPPDRLNMDATEAVEK